MSILPGNIAENVGPVRAPFISIAEADRRTLAQSNGTTNFGKVEAGQWLSEIQSGGDAGKLRPAADTLATDSGAASTGPIAVADSSGFRVGDPLWINGSDTTETVATVPDGVSITASGNVTWNSGETVTAGPDGESAHGINRYDVNTYLDRVDADGAVVHADVSVYSVQAGVINENEIGGNSAALRALVPTLIFRDE